MPVRTTISTNNWTFAVSAVAIMLVIAMVYWPVANAQFVWDDIPDFQQMAWLRHGSDWHHIIFQRFNDWINYFRPLVVALFTLEVRLFHVQPGPMHLVSLLFHLINTLLVGILAMRISAPRLSQSKRIYAFTLPMLLYGLHPVLIEPVAWIGCQFELVATLFMLLGWLCGTGIKRSALRVGSVAICFFLAACAKESAVAFLPILLVFDWFALSAPGNASKWTELRTLLTRNAITYTGVVVAGVVYLALRHRSLGALAPTIGGEVLPAWGRLQEVSFLYMRYWGMFFWPSVDMGPIHAVAVDQFRIFSAWSLLRDIAAIGLCIGGIVLAIKRFAVGGLILCVTFALFPVLHVISANFDSSLYHERYALTALATACIWLPLCVAQISIPAGMRRSLTMGVFVGFSVWTILAIMTINVTLPLWSTQLKLWHWALQENPDSTDVKEQLIAAYIEAGFYTDAWRLINDMVKHNEPCTDCMLNAATLALRENNPHRASFFLKKIKDSPELYGSPTSYRAFLTSIATVQLMEGKPAEAEQVARSAIRIDHLDPTPQLVLVEALVFQGKVAEAKQIEQTALSLMEPTQRAAQHQRFEHLLKVVPTVPTMVPATQQ